MRFANVTDYWDARDASPDRDMFPHHLLGALSALVDEATWAAALEAARDASVRYAEQVAAS